MYRKDESGHYHLMTSAGEIDVGNSVAILFDSATGTLLKHGRPREVQAHHELMAPALGPSIVMLQDKRWSTDILDKMVETSGYIGAWWKVQCEQRRALHKTGYPRA